MKASCLRLFLNGACVRTGYVSLMEGESGDALLLRHYYYCSVVTNLISVILEPFFLNFIYVDI